MRKLNKTWFIDMDGTLVIHNGYLTGKDVMLPESKKFIDSVDKDDVIVITTGRSISQKEATEKFLRDSGLRFNYVLYDLPLGERIVINDEKPSGMKTAYSYNVKRDVGIIVDHRNEDNLQ